jgi:hypothetical protein
VAQASSATAPAVLPPTLVALEQKMEAIQVNSERFSQAIHGTGHTASSEQHGVNGKRIRHSGHVSVDITDVGEVSLSPAEGVIFAHPNASKPSLLLIGATLYAYTPTIARRDGDRPWVRFHGKAAPGTIELFPYHGQPEEVSGSGTGSYAGLINLIATAEGAVVENGPISVDGQQATEFTATVQPLNLIKGLSQKELEALGTNAMPEKLEVFITASGLPVRVIRSTGSGLGVISITTNILAVNAPIEVKRPPLRRTISEAEFLKLEHSDRKTGRDGVTVIETNNAHKVTSDSKSKQ